MRLPSCVSVEQNYGHGDELGKTTSPIFRILYTQQENGKLLEKRRF